MSKLVHAEQGAPAGPAPGAREARKLGELYQDAQHGMRRVVALGLFAHEIKAKLKHGQFGPWLKEHCPDLSREVEGRPLPSTQLSAYMQLASGVLETTGIKLSGWLENTKIRTPDLSHGGEILTIPDAEVPEEAKPIREKICALIDGKTQRQLFAEFKTAEDSADEAEGIKVGSPLGKHHPRKEKSPTPEEILKAKIEAQESTAQIILGDIRTFLRADNTLVRSKVWQALLDIGVELTTTARQRLKADSKKSRKRNAPHVSHTLDTLKQLK